MPAKLNLSNSEFNRQIQNADLQLGLDRVGELILEVAITQDQAENFQVKDLPQSVKVEIDGKQIFEGYIKEAVFNYRSQVTIFYHDKLDALLNSSIDFFGNESNLENYLTQILTPLDFKFQFIGDFSQLVPTLSTNGVKPLSDKIAIG